MHPMSIPVNCDQQLAVCDDHRVRCGAKPRATAARDHEALALWGHFAPCFKRQVVPIRRTLIGVAPMAQFLETKYYAQYGMTD
jgi:hypothetical protein